MPLVEAVYKGPWKGIDVSLPETDIDPSSSPFINNFILRHGEISSRFALNQVTVAPPDGTNVLGLTSFIDYNGMAHTVAITQLGVYQLSYAFSQPNFNGNPWLVIFNFPSTQINAPYAIQNLQGKIYFTNGSTTTWAWNGISNTVSQVGNLAGGATVGAYFMMELGARIVIASTNETSGVFPFRIRWSPVNFASTTFDSATNIGAGLNDSFDCPDTITGLLPIGRTGYVFRSNGITEMIGTSGQGLTWDFNHLWASDRGIGNAFPQTLAGFGPMGIFGSGEAFYKITPNSFNDISLGATDSILADINKATGIIQATIIPVFKKQFPYTCYLLCIKTGDDIVSWLYDIKESNWTRLVFRNKSFTCKPKLVFIQ